MRVNYNHQRYIDQARAVMYGNDKGNYTIPTNGLYPFQWNWDSCLSALGFSYFDEQRAWQEIITLFAHQWEDGMVPHIIFHQSDSGYFPGPDVWQTNQKTPTSGITQPPVAGFVIRKLLERAKNNSFARTQAQALISKVLAWHEWLYRYRDPHNQGLVALIHPWESGRDNSVDWDIPFKAVPVDHVEPYQRRDTTHTNLDHRPTKAQYDRYLSLIQIFRQLAWDNEKIYAASPFQVIDPGFNAILIRSSRDMAWVARTLEQPTYADRFDQLAQYGTEALESLWDNHHQQYLCYDRRGQKCIDSPSVGGLIPLFASTQHAKEITNKLMQFTEYCNYLAPSHNPRTADFDAKRYWRGPVWLIVNYLLITGLRDCGEYVMAQRLIRDSIELIKQSGFAEYYDPITAEACGGGSFTWTAAMVIEFLGKEIDQHV